MIGTLRTLVRSVAPSTVLATPSTTSITQAVWAGAPIESPLWSGGWRNDRERADAGWSDVSFGTVASGRIGSGGQYHPKLPCGGQLEKLERRAGNGWPGV